MHVVKGLARWSLQDDGNEKVVNFLHLGVTAAMKDCEILSATLLCILSHTTLSSELGPVQPRRERCNRGVVPKSEACRPEEASHHGADHCCDDGGTRDVHGEDRTSDQHYSWSDRQAAIVV